MDCRIIKKPPLAAEHRKRNIDNFIVSGYNEDTKRALSADGFPLVIVNGKTANLVRERAVFPFYRNLFPKEIDNCNH